ncbi:DUF1758 domain-containing protein [Trichonephila inaurata madagascariensis]|uniref:DUF1758 domain-containing protein n=1 Tax=Trichonephila inaurata madagascariensis TaxID=2747483 RepID=A0A8X7BUF2_9ARAC|nr:DUF1758 domain-containing protein [Trichonephila inaurata madagascariensis]
MSWNYLLWTVTNSHGYTLISLRSIRYNYGHLLPLYNSSHGASAGKAVHCMMVVNETSSLNDVDKFSYLKSVVTSDAELAIRGLTLTSENYAKAIKILEDRFGRKELIVDFHMNRLLNLTPVRKSFDVIALRNLYDQLEIHIRDLNLLKSLPIPIVVFCFR